MHLDPLRITEYPWGIRQARTKVRDKHTKSTTAPLLLEQTNQQAKHHNVKKKSIKIQKKGSFLWALTGKCCWIRKKLEVQGAKKKASTFLTKKRNKSLKAHPMSSHNCREEKKQDSWPGNTHYVVNGNHAITKATETHEAYGFNSQG